MPKRLQPLTAVQIRTIKPLPKETKLFDGAGLYLLVTPSGGGLWRLKYSFANKEKKLSFGAYPEVSLAQAREDSAIVEIVIAPIGDFLDYCMDFIWLVASKPWSGLMQVQMLGFGEPVSLYTR